MTRPSPSAILIPAAYLAGIGIVLAGTAQPLVADAGSASPVRSVGVAMLVIAGAGCLVALLMVKPAWPLSIGVCLMAFSGNWQLTSFPVPLDRFVILVGLVSVAFRARDFRGAVGGRVPSVYLLVGIAALYGALSLGLSDAASDREAWFALLDRYGLVPFALFVVAPVAFPDNDSRRILLGCLTALGAYLVYTSVLGRLGPRSLVFPQYIVDPSVGIHADRARGPFIEAGANGMALFECGVAAAILASQQIRRGLRVAALVVAVGCAFSIVLTLTRAVWIGSALGLLVALGLTPQTRRLLIPVTAAAVVSVLAALVLVPGLAGDASNRESDQRPIWDRENANAAAVRMIEDRPLFGFGWFQFAVQNADYQRLADDHILTRADLDEHNVFLANAVELGLIGAGIWLVALIVAIGRPLLRGPPPGLEFWRVGLAAIATQWFVIANFVPLGYALPNALIWLWAGVLWRRPDPVPPVP